MLYYEWILTKIHSVTDHSFACFLNSNTLAIIRHVMGDHNSFQQIRCKWHDFIWSVVKTKLVLGWSLDLGISLSTTVEPVVQYGTMFNAGQLMWNVNWPHKINRRVMQFGLWIYPLSCDRSHAVDCLISFKTRVTKYDISWHIISLHNNTMLACSIQLLPS